MSNLADQLKMSQLSIAASIASERDNFRSLFRQTPELICILSGPDHLFEFVNEAHIRVLGFDATGRTVREAQPESVEIHGILDNVYRTGESASLHEIPVTVTDRLRYFNLTYAPRHDVNGRISGIVIMGQEVTDQVLTREILKGQNLALEMTLKNTPLAETLSVIARNVEYHIGRGVMVAIHLICPTTRKLVVEAAPSLPDGYKKALDGRDVDVSLESAFMTETGSVITDLSRDLRWRAHREFARKFRLNSCWMLPIQSANGHLLGSFVMYNRPPHEPTSAEQQVVNLFQHTTSVCIQRHLEASERANTLAALRESEKKLRQAQIVAESANAAKGLFLANMSHEIRTPLGAVMGFLDLIKDTSSPEDIKNYLGVMERNSRQLLRIVDEVLDLSKIEAGKFQVESLTFSLEELLTDIHALMSFKAKDKGLIYSQHVCTNRPDRVIGDPVRVRQILINVIGNAIKFTDRGQVTVDIGFAGDLLKISVEDTGCGISATTAKRLFQPFSQADSSTTRLYGGTGLGLTLTMRLCQALGGNFVLERSEVGQGSKFVATLQVKPVVESPTEIKVKDTAHNLKGLFEGLRVLVVDDSLDNQELIGIMLSRMGAKIEVAENGSEALALAPKGNYDLLLMDIQMPVMDGHEATRRLRGMGFRKPIVALTAHAMKEERCRCHESGFSGFMSKPINKEDLIKTIKEWTKH